ncbi:TonB-dependent siderophore receptor [Rhodovastum atsumiense]|uniref:TonB-dependent siderophore receptor n=1 Tax=Rhodovastum atsumiense TaxID=504468 RepID=A0A5M6IME7_9PROT|nr:TonB-dependent siderophore receptor [Rhodovastum atsumiense]
MLLLSGIVITAPPQAQAQQATSPSEPRVATGIVLETPPVTVAGENETGTSAVPGYVARRSIAGTKTDSSLLETPQSISVITRQQMDEQHAETLNQALRYTPGVAPETRGGIATRYDMLKVRGFDAELYWNGLKLQQNNWYALPQLDPYLLERIDVLRGPSSVLYGQASAGGVISQISKLPTVTPLHEVGVEFGTNEHVLGKFDFSGPLDDEGKYLYRITGIGRMEDGQIKSTRNERLAIAPSFSIRPDADTNLTFLGLYQHDPRSSSYGSVPAEGTVKATRYGRLPADFYDGDPNFEKFDRTQVSLGYLFDKRFNDTWSMHMAGRWFHIDQDYRSVYSNGLDSDERTLARATAASRDRLDTAAFDNNVQARVKTGPVEHTLLAGFDYQHLDSTYQTGFGAAPSLDVWAPVYGQAITPPDRYKVNVRGNQYGLYVQDQAKLGGFVLTLSGRGDWADAITINSGTVARQFDRAFTSRAGLSYIFANGIAPYVSYSESFKPQYGTDAYGKAFVPERGRQYEVGVKYQPTGTNALFTAALFDVTRTNLTTSDPNHPGLSVQSGEARSRGVELEAKLDLTEQLTVTASYTYLDTISTKSNDGDAGKRLPAVPDHTATTWATYTIPGGPLAGLKIGGGVRYIGASASSDHSFTVPDVTLVDAMLRYDLGHAVPRLQGAELHLNIQNALDTRYVASCYYGAWCAYGYQRTVSGGLTYRW